MENLLKTIWNNRFQFMGFIGGSFVFAYLITMCYQIAQTNFFFGKGIIDIDVYERMISYQFQQLISIVMIIVLFFFKTTAKVEDEKDNNKILPNEKI